MGIVYFIQPAEHVGTDRYKLGCSRESCTRRVDLGYNDGTVVHLVEHVGDPFEVERALVRRFNERFTRVGGREFFAGDVKQMLKCFKAVTETLLPLDDDGTIDGDEEGGGEGGGKEEDGVVETNRDIEVDTKDKSSKVFQCSKCNKFFSSNQRLQGHEIKCDGLDKRQCKICLKFFKTKQGRYQHTKNVKCQPPPTQSSSSGVNIIDNSITNTTNNNITNNNTNINIIRNDFYKISEEDIDRIVEKLGDKEYFKIAMSNLDLGKYAIPRTVERIYFNHEFPDMQIIRKERRNDKMVDVHVGNGKWEKRMLDDIFKLVIRRVEEYHTKFFRHLEEKYKNVPVGSVRWKQLMRPIKSFGNCMLWYDGFRGDGIECLGIELNYPDEEDPDIEKERDRRIKEMEQLLGEKVYEESMAVAKRNEAMALAASQATTITS